MNELFWVPCHGHPCGKPLYPRWSSQTDVYLSSCGTGGIVEASWFWVNLLSHMKCFNVHIRAMSLSSSTCPGLLAGLFIPLEMSLFGSLLSTHRLSLFLWLLLFEVFWNQKVSHTVIFWYVSLSWGRALELPNLMNGQCLQLWDSFDLMVYGFHFHLSQCVITYPISKQHFRWKILNLIAGWGCSIVVPQELWGKGFI